MVDHDVRLSLQVGDEAETYFQRCWDSYELDQDLREWPMTWRLTMGPMGTPTTTRFLERVAHNPVARCYVGGTLICTGRVETWEPGGGRENGRSFLNVAGTGPLGQAAEDDVPLGWSPRNLTIGQAVTELLSKWGIEVRGSNELQRAAVTRRTTRAPDIAAGRAGVDVNAAGNRAQQVGTGTVTTSDKTTTVFDDRAIRPRPGEKRLEWLRRFLAHHKLLACESADGALFIGVPDYDQAPMADIVRLPDGSQPREGCVASSRAPRRPGRQPSSVTVTGRVERGGQRRVKATVADQDRIDRGWLIDRIVADDQVRDQAQAQAKAESIVAAEAMRALEYEAEITGHGVGPYLLAPDTIVRVRDAICALDGVLMYVVKRSFSYDRKAGARVKIGCVLPGLWLPTSGE